MTLRDIIQEAERFQERFGVRPNTIIFNEEPDLENELVLLSIKSKQSARQTVAGFFIIIDDAATRPIAAALVAYD